MKLLDTALLALTALQHRHLRSWLAILGIVVGVAAIVSLISISFGMSDQINSRINTLGANVITISPGGNSALRGGIPGLGGGGPPAATEQRNFLGNSGSTGVISFSEADALRTIPGISVLDARVSGRETVAYKDKNTSITIVGSEPDAFKDTVGVAVLYGRPLTISDKYSVVLGFSVANRTFNDLDMLNKQIKIGDKTFRVVGILNSSGSSNFGSSDNTVFMPQKTAKDLLNKTTVSTIVAIVSADHDTTDVAAAVEAKLNELHHLSSTDKEDFSVTTAATTAAALASVTDTLALFLGGIASISLIVGGIGVANAMFMSVIEQTKYIGILKALGTKSSEVLQLFLFEAGVIGLVGGVLGIALSFLVSFVLTSFSLPSRLSPDLIIGALLFSVVVGVVSGLVPARNAASLQPIDALRYE